jgi:predicted nucleic-acid-binding protein
MTYVDANVILRYLLDDDPVLSPEAIVRLDGLDEKHSGIEVVAELVYVLAGVYQIPRIEISETLTRFFENDSWKLHRKDAVLESIKIYGQLSIDYVDAFLVALHRLADMEILSFDRRVRRLTR